MEELSRLSEHAKQTFAGTTRAVTVVSLELKSLEAEEITLVNAIEASNQALASANDQIENARQMIARVNILLSKAEPVRES